LVIDQNLYLVSGDYANDVAVILSLAYIKKMYPDLLLDFAIG